jgi:hypothetical protein
MNRERNQEKNPIHNNNETRKRNLRVNLVQEMNNIYNEKYKVLMKETEEDTE